MKTGKIIVTYEHVCIREQLRSSAKRNSSQFSVLIMFMSF